MEGDRINLIRGESKKLTLIASYEEGFRGDVSFTFSGLPDGVQAFPGVQYNNSQGPLERIENADIIAPKEQKTTVILVANTEARLTAEPVVIQLQCQPIVNGKLGPSLQVRELPLMVIDARQPRNGWKNRKQEYDLGIIRP